MKRRYRSSIAAAVITLGLGSAAAATANDAVTRLQASVAAAFAGSPQLEMADAEARSRQLAFAAEGSSGAPFVELQTEGRSASFDHKANGADYLRVGKPFLLPWQKTRARQLNELAESELVASRWDARSVLATEVVTRWLESAAVSERQVVVDQRLAAVDHALLLLRERLRFGEVAGSEVLLLELDRSREASRAAELAAAYQAANEGLRLLCGEGLQPPRAGDLSELARRLGDELDEKRLGLAVELSPPLNAATTRAATAEARAALVASIAYGIPEADVEWERIPELDGVPGHDALGLRLSMPLPLGREGRLAREAAAAEAQAAVAAAELAEQQLREELRAAQAAFEAAAARRSALAPGLKRLDDAEHSLAEQVRLGAISSLIYLDVRSRLDELRLESIAATHQLLESRVRLARLLASSELFPLPWSEFAEVNP